MTTHLSFANFKAFIVLFSPTQIQSDVVVSVGCVVVATVDCVVATIGFAVVVATFGIGVTGEGVVDVLLRQASDGLDSKRVKMKTIQPAMHNKAMKINTIAIHIEHFFGCTVKGTDGCGGVNSIIFN